MSAEFVKERIGNSSIAQAVKQQEQLAYFTQSDIQEDITEAYLNAWAKKKYATDDYFLNWIKAIFKTDNFLSFFKYYRHPIASSSLINDRIKTPLSRVFFSEDSYFKYTIKGQEVEEPEELDITNFNEWIFNALLFRFNDIMVTDLEEVNKPFRQLIPIKNVVAIESHHSVIHKIAYSASTVIIDENGNSKKVQGFLYIDKFDYIFYDQDVKPLLTIPHDLGECPADYIAREPFSDDDVVRKSIFSHSRPDLEEYVFLRTLQKMTEPNGAIPIVTKIKTGVKENKGQKDETNKDPMSSNSIGGQQADFGKEVAGQSSLLQAGNIIEVPVIKKTDGSIDTTIASNLINFHYTPIEALTYVNTRILEVKQEIIVSLLGDFTELNPVAVNELQVGRSFVSKEDKLRSVSLDLSRIRTRSDYKFLALQYGKDNITNQAFYGSDFFLETQAELYDLFEKSPNTIERKNILIRLTKNRNRFNKERSQREVILYHLMPYVSDKDFKDAIDGNKVDDITFQYQTRFNYWIGAFEAQYGDILIFWESIEGTDSEKLILINNLILQIINQAIVPVTPEETPEETPET